MTGIRNLLLVLLPFTKALSLVFLVMAMLLVSMLVGTLISDLFLKASEL